jgi:NAD(P)H dehydrogenase (quinone)
VSRATRSSPATRVLVVYDTVSGTHRELARRCGSGAAFRGAEVRVRSVAEAAEADVRWCDALVLGSPTHFGSPTPGTMAFLDSLRGLWLRDELRGLVVAAVSSSRSPRGGRESTILDLQRAAQHLGAVVVPGHWGPRGGAHGPYGVSLDHTDPPSQDETARAVDDLMASVCDVATRLHGQRRVERPRVLVVAERGDAALAVIVRAMADQARSAGAEPVVLDPGTAAVADCLADADAVVVGTRVRASQPEPSVVDLLRGWGASGPSSHLAGMPVSAFVVTDRPDDGAEAGLQSVYASLQHAGAVVVPSGPPKTRPPGGSASPYGTSTADPLPGPGTVVEAHEQMRGLIDVAGRLARPVGV